MNLKKHRSVALRIAPWFLRTYIIVPLIFFVTIMIVYSINLNRAKIIPNIHRSMENITSRESKKIIHKEIFDPEYLSKAYVIKTKEEWDFQLLIFGDKNIPFQMQKKRSFVKKMMADAWASYVEYGFGYNEVNVVTKNGISREEIYHSIKGVSIVDSLDTLLIMGMFEEYMLAREWVSKNLNFNTGMVINLFETNIRIFGGLLSAYYLTDDTLYLDKAISYADLTLPAFKTTFPSNIYTLSNERIGSAHGTANLAEIGTLHLEYAALSKLTNDTRYLEAVTKIRTKLSEIFYSNEGPMVNSYVISSLEPSGSHFSIGSGGDSFYEYLLKSYIQNSSNTLSLQFFKDTINRLEKDLLKYTSDGYEYFGNGNTEHLACFAGGMYALASKFVQTDLAKKYLKRGEELTRTCVKSCTKTKTGLCPEIFIPELFKLPSHIHGPYYLRPEIMESIFYLFRITKDESYREIAWKIIESIDTHTRVSTGGFSSVKDVSTIPTVKLGQQESFFMSETLKYAYLIFSNSEFISLENWVFNTEAHPFLRIEQK